MTDKSIYPFYVDGSAGRWSSDRFETLTEAEAFARKTAYSNGSDQHIFKCVATAKAPEEINSVKITAVQ